MQPQQPKYFFKFTDVFNDNGTVWYTIQVHTRGEEQQTIIFKSRYSEMREIHERCAANYKNDLPQFPEKKFFNSTKQEFIQKRKKELENYYNTLAKTMDIDKMKDLHHLIESHRKVKRTPTKIVKPVDDEALKLDAKLKKENQLRAGFQAIYQQVTASFLNIGEDVEPIQGPEEFTKRFQTQLQKIKPGESKILAIQVQGVEENEGDFWTMFFRDQNDDFLHKTSLLGEKITAVEREIQLTNKEIEITKKISV